MKKKRNILVVLVDRANYGRMRMVMQAIKNHPELDLSVMCAGSMVLERFGNTVATVEKDGFRVDSQVFMELEGSVPLSMAKSLGFGIIEFAGEYHKLKPDIVLLIGDRYEALAAAVAAAYMNIPVAHIQGGEVSGSIDESARHAITKFAQWHFPATNQAAKFIHQMGEPVKNIFTVGCPVGDYILQLDDQLPNDAFNEGSGAPINPHEDFLLVIFHPVTTSFGGERNQVRQLLEALCILKHPTVFLWPNIDAGADHISKEMRIFRDREKPSWLRFMTNLPPVVFQKVLKRCAVAVGNSSSFVRDSTFSGTPVVLIGDRQKGREIGLNVTCIAPDKKRIKRAIIAQLHHGRYEPETLFGDGKASERIVNALARVDLFLQKQLCYIDKSEA